MPRRHMFDHVRLAELNIKLNVLITWPRERKAVLKFGVKYLANSFPACPAFAPPLYSIWIIS